MGATRMAGYRIMQIHSEQVQCEAEDLRINFSPQNLLLVIKTCMSENHQTNVFIQLG